MSAKRRAEAERLARAHVTGTDGAKRIAADALEAWAIERENAAYERAAKAIEQDHAIPDLNSWMDSPRGVAAAIRALRTDAAGGTT